MDTNVIIAIVVAVVVIAAIIIGAWWFGKASKRSVERATDEAVAKGVQLATEDTEHAGNADADHTQHAEVSAASAEVAGTAAVKAQKPSVSAVASAAEEPPVAKTVVETPEAAGTRMQRSRLACPSPATRSAKPCSTSSPRISSPKPTGRTSKTPCCSLTSARRRASNWWRSCATTPASPASPIRPKCVRR